MSGPLGRFPLGADFHPLRAKPVSPSSVPAASNPQGQRVASSSRFIEHLEQSPESSQGPSPHILNAVLGSAKTTSHFRETQALELSEDDDLPVILRKFADRVGQKDRLLTTGRLMAGRAQRRNQVRIQSFGRTIEVVGKLPFEPHVSPLGPEIVSDLVGQDGNQDLPQPAQKLAFRSPTELPDPTMRFQKRVLEHVRHIELPLNAAPDL